MGVVRELTRHLPEDAGARVDQDPALRQVAEGRVVVPGVLDELPHLGERLDTGVAGADEDEGEVAARVARIGLGEVELTDYVVAQVDGVGQVLEGHRVLCQPWDGQHPGDRAQGDHETSVGHLYVADLRLNRDRPSGRVQRRDPTPEQLGVRTHLAQRHERVPWLDGAGSDLGKKRGVEHRVLGADDGGFGEQARHVGPAEPSAEDQGATPGAVHHGLRTRQVAPPIAMTRPPQSTT
jgi:hypothetical protein